MVDIRLSEIWIYPVKSLRGISLHQGELDARGLRYDRHWMVVDSEGNFLTQRQLPRMCLLSTMLDSHALHITAPDDSVMTVPFDAEEGRMTVTVWNDRCEAVRCGATYDRWLSEFLATPCHLVRFPERQIRQVDQRYAQPHDQTGFADGFPLLLISQASLDELNDRLTEALPMRRFRPNLVVTGTDAYDEDCWDHIQIGEISMRVVKPCSRCAITRLDPETAEKSREPLKTLSEYRREGSQVMFGQNVIHDQIGLISCGDSILLE